MRLEIIRRLAILMRVHTLYKKCNRLCRLLRFVSCLLGRVPQQSRFFPYYRGFTKQYEREKAENNWIGLKRPKVALKKCYKPSSVEKP